jgi:hypothetical protein
MEKTPFIVRLTQRWLTVGLTSQASAFYLGIKDCDRAFPDELERIVKAIFDTLCDLYVKVGARNFVLVDLPPFDRSPRGKGNLECPP